jgi:hypothetical protein
MNVIASTAAYERWLRKFFAPIEVDLARKHELMRHDRFTFFRATFYRWAQNWDRVAAPVRAAPPVLAIGDAHVENFGTWRDGEGRLVWGTNDFDEAAPIPYTNDLVRLAASAVLAHAEGQLFIASAKICDAVLLGYTGALAHGGRPIVLDAGTRWLRDLVDSNLRDADHYWQKLLASPKWRGTLSHRTQSLLAAGPKNAQLLRVIHRTSGAGSLGRPRLTAIYLLDGGYAAREVKARTPSAWHWAHGDSRKSPDPLPRVWRHAIRSQDPFLDATKRWVVRRLAPDCSRISLAAIPKRRKEAALLSFMGWDLANIHLGSSRPRPVQEHLRKLGSDWLPAAVDTMLATTIRDYQLWKRHK